MSIDMTLQKWAIFIMGVYGEISSFLSDPTEILFLVILRHTSWKFQLEIRSNKKVIAKKPLTNLYEMNSSFECIVMYRAVSHKEQSSFYHNGFISDTYRGVERR